jgi:fatty acid desaturase
MGTDSLRERTRIYDGLRKSLLNRDEVRAFSKLSPLPPARDIAISWFCIVLVWSLVARWPSVLSVALALPLIGSRYYALFIIGHDGLHRRLFRNRMVNDLVNDVFVMGPVGAITRLNNGNHIRHHERLATPGDPDRHKYSCLNKSDLAGLWKYITGATSVTKSLRNVFGRSPSADSPSKATGSRYTIRDWVILAGVQSTLLIGLTATFGWWAYPVLWLLPVYVFAFLADNLRTFAEHAHPEADSVADTHRLISYLPGPVERAFLSPMNMNYHAVHHLWPSIPYYQLPAADLLVRGRAQSTGLEWRRSYLGFLARYAHALPLSDCRPKA